MKVTEITEYFELNINVLEKKCFFVSFCSLRFIVITVVNVFLYTVVSILRSVQKLRRHLRRQQ